ncbi:MAG: Niacin transporter NiaX [Firmicutes bacterium ADurb.Bin193]|nr:MAG: Niacin transporter NiaX [Firmicutes bacterium ADurb.Bin193]
MRTKTSELVMTALLTSIAVIIPLIVPLKIVLPPFTATFASHVPLILAMFINPAAAISVALGSALGFFFAMGPIGPVVAARAAMHVFFVAIGSYMIKKRFNLYLVIFATMILHSASDMLIVYLLFKLFGQTAIIGGYTMQFVQIIIGVGTSLHHLVDFAITMVIYYPLSKIGDLLMPVSVSVWNKKSAAK